MLRRSGVGLVVVATLTAVVDGLSLPETGRGFLAARSRRAKHGGGKQGGGEPAKAKRTKGRKGPSDTADRLAADAIAEDAMLAVVLEYTGALDGVDATGKGKKLKGQARSGLDWSLAGDPAGLPLAVWVSLSKDSGGTRESLAVGSTYTVAEAMGLGKVKLYLGAAGDDDVSHKLSFEAGCSGDGIQLGDLIGPFEVVALSSVACPDSTAQGCGQADCISAPVEQPVGSTTSPDDLTSAASTSPPMPPLAAKQGTAAVTTVAASTSAAAVPQIRIATAATGTKVDQDVSVCFQTGDTVIEVGNTVVIDGMLYVVKQVSAIPAGDTCVLVTETVTDELASCSQHPGCDVSLQTDESEATEDPLLASLPPLVTELPSLKNTAMGSEAVCTFGLYPFNNGGCSGIPADVLNITSSVGFVTQKCAMSTTDASGSDCPLWLTTQPICATGTANVPQEWSLCSWQPDETKVLCKAANQQCCDYVANYVDFDGPLSIDIACQVYAEGDCSTLYGFDGANTHKYFVQLIGCEGTVPNDPQCAVPLTEDGGLSPIKTAAAGAFLALIVAIAVFVVAMVLRRRRIKNEHTAGSLPTDPLLGASVAALDPYPLPHVYERE